MVQLLPYYTTYYTIIVPDMKSLKFMRDALVLARDHEEKSTLTNFNITRRSSACLDGPLKNQGSFLVLLPELRICVLVYIADICTFESGKAATVRDVVV